MKSKKRLDDRMYYRLKANFLVLIVYLYEISKSK